MAIYTLEIFPIADSLHKLLHRKMEAFCNSAAIACVARALKPERSRHSIYRDIKSQIRLAALILYLPPLVYASSTSPLTNAPRFVIRGDTVLDTQTHLVWQRCSIGQHWDGKSCAGEIKLMNWREAQKISIQGWRIPSKAELTTLIDQDRKRLDLAPFINVQAFPEIIPLDGDKKSFLPFYVPFLFYWTNHKAGITNCFAVPFGKGSRTDIVGDGYVFCNFYAAVRLVQGGTPHPIRPWSD